MTAIFIIYRLLLLFLYNRDPISAMRFQNLSLFLLGSQIASTSAFAPQAVQNGRTSLYATNNQQQNVVDTIESIDATVKGALSGMALAAALWTSPALMAGTMGQFPTSNNVFSSSIASAKEMASGSGTRVNKDPESLLRYGLPIKNKEVRDLQKSIEDIRLNVSSKRKTAALDDLKKARGIINTKESKMTPSCRDAKVCSDILASMKSEIEPLETQLRASVDYQSGSEQERKALDESYSIQDKIQKELTTLQEQMIPAGKNDCSLKVGSRFKTNISNSFSSIQVIRHQFPVIMMIFLN